MWIAKETCGLDLKLFGLELLTGIERTCCMLAPIREEQVAVIATIKMDAPDDIEKFRHKILNHFLQFRRYRSCLKQFGSDFFLSEVKDQSILNNIVTIHPEALTEEDVRRFVTKQHEDLTEVQNELPACKIWLIPVDSESSDSPGE